MSSTKILLVGASGQLGHALRQRLQAWQHTAAGQDVQCIASDRQQLDLSRPRQIREAIRSIKPTLIVNAAAYTPVDQAESEPALVHSINADAPALMAEEARRHGAALIHYSTDYVFDGAKTAPYTEADTPNPLNAYGRSKLAGDQAIQAAGIPHLILRTGWVYGWHGHNFLRTILRLALQEPALRIVNDQWGTPTWSATLADATLYLVAQACHTGAAQNTGLQENWWQDHGGLYHCAAQGQATWHGFAQAILAHAPWPNNREQPVVHPVTTAEFARPARRPPYSVMACNKFGEAFYPLPEWQTALRQCLASHAGLCSRERINP